MAKPNPMPPPWSDIRKSYESGASYARSKHLAPAEQRFAVMLDLIDAIGNSPCARFLHAWSTHYDLCIVRGPGGGRPGGGRIQISPILNPRLFFQYKPHPRDQPSAWSSKGRTWLPIEDDELRMTIAAYGQGVRWVEESGYSHGIAKLQEILERLHWCPKDAVLNRDGGPGTG